MASGQHHQAPHLHQHPHIHSHPKHLYGFPVQQAPPPVYHDPGLASLAYRPLLQQQQHQQQEVVQQQTAQHHQQISLAAAAALHFQPAVVPHQQLHQQLPRKTLHQQPHPAHQIMADPSYQQPIGTSEEELAEFQKLSNEWQAEAKGPFVGQRQPSTAITTEYASADPVFQAKTAALPHKYSHYRTVRGDGSCGWRAITFGYYETLIHLGDANKFLEEEARLRSLNNVLIMAGYEPTLFEDFAHEVFQLLRTVAAGMQDGTAETVLYDTFNNEEIQPYIITHFRTLTAAWMKTHPAEYAPWIQGQTVDEFCTNSVLPMVSELEQVSLSALKDVLLSPAGITLEVLYLDRSEGSEVNSHRFSPVNNIFDIGTIRLLYRPGHYDMVYAPQDLPPMEVPAPMPTYLQYASQTYQEPAYSVGMPDFMLEIPGMSYANPHQHWMSSSSCAAEPDFFAMPAPVPQYAAPVPTPAMPAPQPQMQPTSAIVQHPTAQLVPPPVQLHEELVIRTAPPSAASSQTSLPCQVSNSPFRPSRWEWQNDFVQQLPLQTNIFKNSHYNIAHFNNPDFQPEEWRPEDEYAITKSKPSKHKNCG